MLWPTKDWNRTWRTWKPVCVCSKVEAVRRLQGVVTSLAKRLPRLSTIMEPIRQLTRQDCHWELGDGHWPRCSTDASKSLMTAMLARAWLNLYPTCRSKQRVLEKSCGLICSPGTTNSICSSSTNSVAGGKLTYSTTRRLQWFMFWNHISLAGEIVLP